MSHSHDVTRCDSAKKCDNLLDLIQHYFAALWAAGIRIVSLGSSLATSFRFKVVQCSAASIDNVIVVPDFCAQLAMERGIRAVEPR